ncbi:MAG: type VI secretion system baseplate subunit TssE [Pseudomonadota bacterium]
MRDRTLFQRLLAAGEDEPVDTPFDESALVESVLENLSRVFNSRVGTCEARPDYGLPDFNGVIGHVPDAVGRISVAIRDRIVAFEPRLETPTVRALPDPDNPLQLGFQIYAQLRGEGDTKIAFETVLGDNGKVRVRN